ncbi:hypothetical protein AALO_G00035080 [Alosa alosa]|uniref:Ig-like domain-containing protein n=1 Tax=Alosa alosa TaxID=278164 RepID=A0AAV6H667_9TELE|nr:hypothetical protein AALO_G00035080 [Alosa alosa]
MKDLYWSLLVLCIISTAAGVEVVGPDGPVVAVVGEDLILPCSLNSSTSAADDEVTWLIGTKIVHHHKNRQDFTDQQLPAYRGRTSLFTEELQRGNLSLKIRNVTLSDANTYRCYIATDTMPAEVTVSVTVETVGSTPVISAEGLGNGSARLQCESSGWSSEPQVEWVDSEGRSLPVDPPCIQRFPEGLRVKSSVTVEQSDGSNFLCRVTSPGQTRETRVEVPRPQFDHTRHYYWIMAPFGLLILILLIIIGCQSRVISGMSQELLSQPFPETSADNMKIKWNNEEARVYLYKNGHVIERSGTVSDLQEGEISVRLRRNVMAEVGNHEQTNNGTNGL